MAEPTFDTVAFQGYLDRWQAGDRTAADELLRAVGTRLRKLADRMTRAFPNLRGKAETDDVLQNSLMRLLRTLQKMRPASTRDFFNLAAVHIRRELLDIARHWRGKSWVSLANGTDDSAIPHSPDPPAPAEDSDLWVRFHTAVDELPVEQREVVGLAFYHGWTQGQIAEMFQVDERTIRRRWATACQRLREIVGRDTSDVWKGS
jgi:RNA polymerase sigma factor (sigma-70 family)